MEIAVTVQRTCNCDSPRTLNASRQRFLSRGGVMASERSSWSSKGLKVQTVGVSWREASRRSRCAPLSLCSQSMWEHRGSSVMRPWCWTQGAARRCTNGNMHMGAPKSKWDDYDHYIFYIVQNTCSSYIWDLTSDLSVLCKSPEHIPLRHNDLFRQCNHKLSWVTTVTLLAWTHWALWEQWQAWWMPPPPLASTVAYFYLQNHHHETRCVTHTLETTLKWRGKISKTSQHADVELLSRSMLNL